MRIVQRVWSRCFIVRFLGRVGMAFVPGSYYNIFAGNQVVNFGVTSDPNNVTAPVAGDFNLEVITDASGTGSFATASGYQGLAIISTNGSVFTAAHGNYGVEDTGGNDRLFAGAGNVSILGAPGDTLTGGNAGNQLLDAHLGKQLVIGVPAATKRSGVAVPMTPPAYSCSAPSPAAPAMQRSPASPGTRSGPAKAIILTFMGTAAQAIISLTPPAASKRSLVAATAPTERSGAALGIRSWAAPVM